MSELEKALDRLGDAVARLTESSARAESRIAELTAERDRLKAELKASVGSDVELAQVVDPSILGGLIVKVGSRMVDNSLRTKLQNLKVAMKGVS